MKWRLLAALIGLLSLPVLAKGPEQQLPVYDFSKGVDTYHSGLSLPDGFVQDSLNVIFNGPAPVSTRQGFTVAFSSKAYHFQTAWTYTDSTNTTWAIVRASDSIIASNLQGSVVVISTVSSNNLVGEVNALGNAYFVDQTQGVYYWNGTTTIYVSSSPKGSLITQFHGRVWVSGLAVPSGNQLYGSKYLDGTIWTSGLNPNDPVQFTVGLQDQFDNITALYPFLDTMYVFKHYSTYALYGFDQTNFQISFITSECGCIDQQSIQSFNHGLDFASERGIEFFDGYTCTRISDPVKNKVDAAIQSQGGANTLSWVQSSQSDWQAGSFNFVSATISPPSLVLSTGTQTDSQNSDFASGTFTNTQLSGNSVIIGTNSIDVLNNSFETVTGGSIPNWNSVGGGGWSQINSQPSTVGCPTFTPKDGSVMIGETIGQSAFSIDFIDSLTSATISTISQGGSQTCAWTLGAVSMTGNDRRWGRIRINHGGIYFISDPFISNGKDIQFYWAQGFVNAGANYETFYDFFTNGPKSSIASGSFTSRSFDTKMGAPYVSASSATTVNTEGITFTLESSPNNSSWSPVSAAGLGQRYERYISTFTLGPIDTALSALTNFTWSSVSSSGVWTSQSHSISGASSLGNFVVAQDLSTGGNIAFTLCTSSSSNMVTQTCKVQTSNSQILVSTGTFIDIIATFTITASSNVPKLQATTIQWFTGANSPPMASTVFDNRYWLSLTTSTTDGFNDAILVLSKDGVWSIFDIHAGGLTQLKNSLYHSDSLGTGNFYLDNAGQNDNGSAINAYIRTKDYAMGGLTEDDFIGSIWPTMDNLGNYNVSIGYYVDRSTTAFSLSSINQQEFIGNASIKIPFPIDSTHQDFGKTISYKFTANDLNEPWNFYGFREVFHNRPTQ